jgi:hypothetical protein
VKNALEMKRGPKRGGRERRQEREDRKRDLGISSSKGEEPVEIHSSKSTNKQIPTHKLPYLPSHLFPSFVRFPSQGRVNVKEEDISYPPTLSEENPNERYLTRKRGRFGRVGISLA